MNIELNPIKYRISEKASTKKDIIIRRNNTLN